MLYIKTEDEAIKYLNDPNYILIDAKRAGFMPGHSIQVILDRTWDDEKLCHIRQETWERYRHVQMDTYKRSAINITSKIKALADAGTDVILFIPEYRGFHHSARRIIAEWLYQNGIADIDTEVPIDQILTAPACPPGQETLKDKRKSDNINAGRTAFLKPGRLLTDDNGNLFVYLGYYTGRNIALNPKTNQGYLYVQIWPWDMIKQDISTAADSDFINCRQGLRVHLKPGNFENWSCYVKMPKQFKNRYQVIDLAILNTQSINGLTRVADKK